MTPLKCSRCFTKFDREPEECWDCPKCGDMVHVNIFFAGETPDHKSILEEAQGLVHGDRNNDYGNPWEDYARTVDIFKVLMGEKKISDMTALDGIMFMVCVKLSREVNAPGRDNLVDLAGYAECYEWSKENV